MKKIFWACTLALMLIYSTSAKAEEVDTNTYEKTQLDLEEIVFDKDQSFKPFLKENTFLAADFPVDEEKTLNKEITLEDKENRTVDKKNEEKSFFDIFNLKGGIQKTESSPESEKTVVQNWLEGDYATAKWFGARPFLEEHGLTINSSLLYSPFVKTLGGASGDRNGKGYSLYNLGVALDTEKARMWKGGKFFMLYQRKAGYGISGANGDNGAMGDWMGLDGWDWRQINQISEYWYQQTLFNDKIRLKLGRQDANSDFGFLNSGWDFINTAFSVNPTVPMPTYPDQAFGFMAEVNPKEWLSIRNGIYSKFNSPFNITEIEIKPTIKKLPGRYIIGAWEWGERDGFEIASGYNPSTDTTSYNKYSSNFGAYAGFEQMLYKEKKDDDNDMQGLVAFGQFGISPSKINDMSRYAGGGLHYKGPIPKRDNDIAGIGVASGTFASRLANITSQVGDETAIEAFYRIQFTPWFYLQPDIQFITNPGGTYDNSFAFGLRTVITF